MKTQFYNLGTREGFCESMDLLGLERAFVIHKHSVWKNIKEIMIMIQGSSPT